MKCVIRGVPVHYTEYGQGRPVLNIHGWGPAGGSISGSFEPVYGDTPGYRRIYPDLPGFGQTPQAPWMHNSDDMLDLLCDFVEAVIGRESFLLTGCSYGGYLSMGLIHRMAARIDGVFLLIPLTVPVAVQDMTENVAKWRAIYQSPDLTSLENTKSLRSYLSTAVVADPAGFAKWERFIRPEMDMVDREFLSRHSIMDYGPDTERALSTLTFDKPSCILTGRQDPLTGYTKPYELAQRFPRATFAALDCAGHILQFDNEPVFLAMVKDWLWRVGISS